MRLADEALIMLGRKCVELTSALDDMKDQMKRWRALAQRRGHHSPCQCSACVQERNFAALSNMAQNAKS